MDIKLTHSLLTEYLDTKATPDEIAKALSLCGPTVDRMETIDGEVVYDIEVITNRVDAASAFGIAREANAILPQFKTHSSLVNNPYQLTLKDLGTLPSNSPVSVTITNPTLIPRFAAIAISNVTVKPSSKEVQKNLDLSGERSINNVIDVTNELTLRFGQPVHVFDLDRIKDQVMIVRESKPNEKVITLDGRTHTLQGGDIVIEDGEGRLIDLCGIMGGDLSSVTEDTKNILLFVQTYEPKRIRRTSLYTQERTLAAQLFEKQTDPELVLPVLISGVHMMLERAGGTISSSLIDLYHAPRPVKTLTLDLEWLHNFTGISIPKDTIIDILNRLGFVVKSDNSTTHLCQVPSWRSHDISIKEDLAEEVTRVYGYFRLASIIPSTDIPAIGTESKLTLEIAARNFMAKLGFTEIYNSALVSKELVNKTDIDPKIVFKLQNPLSEDYQYLRPSLIPSLLENVETNRGSIQPPLKIFEVSNVYHKATANPLAYEPSTLAFVVKGEAYRQAKGYIESLLKRFKVNYAITSCNNTPKPFVDKKTAAIEVDGKIIGYFGVIGNEDIIGCELNFDHLAQKASLIHQFQAVPTTPPIIEDLTFTLPKQTQVGPILSSLKDLHPLIENIDLKTIYEQNYTFTVTYRSPQSSLTSEEIAPIREKIVDHMEQKFNSTLVGKLT